MEAEKNEDYWYLSDSGVLDDYWDCNAVSSLDGERYIRGNIFKTEEEAEWQDQHRIVATELKHFVAENDPRPITEEDWGDGGSRKTKKYFIRYDYWEKHIWVDGCYSSKGANQVYASNKKVLKQAIEHIGEDRLKKYYFGVGVGKEQVGHCILGRNAETTKGVA